MPSFFGKLPVTGGSGRGIPLGSNFDRSNVPVQPYGDGLDDEDKIAKPPVSGDFLGGTRFQGLKGSEDLGPARSQGLDLGGRKICISPILITISVLLTSVIVYITV